MSIWSLPPFYNDHLGAPHVVTDTQGEIVWQAQYKVYGNVVQYEVQAIDNPIRFQGQYHDAETGLHYNGIGILIRLSGGLSTRIRLGF